MQRILLLAYHFPPLGGAGTQRNAKLARYLKEESGIDLTVVTGPGGADYRWTPIDSSMDDEIDESVRIVRLPGPEPPRRAGLRGRFERWLRLETAWQAWWTRETVRATRSIGDDVDVVYASLNPFETATAAIDVARVLGKPLVLDLEDPWALDEMLTHETRLHARLERRLMRRTLGRADAIVMNTPEAEARVRAAFPELGGTPITSIVNGFDAADFTAPVPARDDGIFRIVHTGSLHQWAARRTLLRRVLGGTEASVDLLTRSLRSLMPALEQVLDERPELHGRIEVHLAGRVTDDDRAGFAGSALVREHGFLSHPEAAALIQSADLLFLPMHDLPAGRRVGIVPCKTYEYLGSGRPILAAVPDGDARDMLLEAGNAYVCRPSDVAGIASAILVAVDAAVNEPASAPDPALLARLERRRLTRDLVAFLDSLSVGTGSRELVSQAR
jgi:glycosyltransferase involved in cell wall biosynthesis